MFKNIYIIILKLKVKAEIIMTDFPCHVSNLVHRCANMTRAARLGLPGTAFFEMYYSGPVAVLAVV